ncbi:hypothetical protein K144313037_23100 [Clostridium tetani]|uniref:hypothetical protein n=1 Tax=Clostridium tetani TaxID=1513 RepID=UPI0029537A85|nr:hypothetical protein [Clostridium tetani]BDR70898.1 hypothetical protein K144313037_23100 [Clostridium tetani]BEV20535.1 hypothetical protein K154301001_23900 [Clostridium tetani]
MYRIINENIDSILLEKSRKHFKDYYYLLDNLKKVNVAEDMEYQKKYKSFWVMGRRSEKYYKCYFDILENNKYNKDITLEFVIKGLYKTELYKNARVNFEFSFSSKLIHMINNGKPIYDSKIANFYNLPKCTGNDFVERLSKANKIYGFLDYEFRRIKNERLLNSSINKVRTYYDLNEKITDEKIIDSIIWMFISYAESGIDKIKYK